MRREVSEDFKGKRRGRWAEGELVGERGEARVGIQDQVVMPGMVSLCGELGRETSAWGMRGLGDRSVCIRRKRVA